MKVASLLRFLLHTHTLKWTPVLPQAQNRQKYKNFLFAAPENLFQ